MGRLQSRRAAGWCAGLLNSKATKTALRNFLFLAMPSAQQEDYLRILPRKKPGIEDSPDVKSKRLMKMKAQSRLSKPFLQ